MSTMSLLAALLNNVMGQGASDSKANDNDSAISLKEENVDTENINILCQDGKVSREREPLEWKFIDFSKAQRCPIFDVDPVMLKKFIGHNVTVRSSSRQEFHGCCLAIDPVSLRFVFLIYLFIFR